ncbi:MAG: tRNA (adenosine(37)-N6)-threonylcarbamoyltransferase complex dimerization subunit type 1 TsaB [Saprospirales bacterium]|nr:tRNA (adenosine(37)-N6)-threonylcarbamoyltransferase complex dimerization subunit type 1 TsaB [Saprospirales bacterium]
MSFLHMAKILLIETATAVCSAAIALDGEVIALAEDADTSNHAARLTLLIQACTSRSGFSLAGLDAVALSHGPGSYTALRVGASVAKGICYALDKPLIAVSTLQALAQAALHAYGAAASAQAVIALPMLDARRNEVWTAAFNADLQDVLPPQPLVLEHDLFVNFIETIRGITPGAVFVVSGNGAFKLFSAQNIEGTVCGPVQNCSAAYLAALAESFFQSSNFQDLTYYEPFYMKPPHITVSKKAPY